MALKRPDMSKGTKKCRCGFGENILVIYDPEDPCEVGGKEAFIEEECDCLTPTVVGPIQVRVTPASGGANVIYVSGNGTQVLRTTTPWFSIYDPTLWTEKNENDLYYRHTPFVYGQDLLGIATDNQLDRTSCVFNFKPQAEGVCQTCHPEWVKKYTTTKTRCCHYTVAGDGRRAMNFAFLGVNRYDPTTGYMETFVDNNGDDRCFRIINISFPPYVVLSSDIDICQEGFCDITTCLCQIPPGYTWTWTFEYRYPNEALYEDNSFDPLNDSHWIYV